MSLFTRDELALAALVATPTGLRASEVGYAMACSGAIRLKKWKATDAAHYTPRGLAGIAARPLAALEARGLARQSGGRWYPNKQEATP